MTVEALDQTTLNSLNSLESRLLRIEHLLYGPKASLTLPGQDTASKRIETLERRLNGLVSRVRVYSELLRIQKNHPSLFHAASPSDPPTQLSIDELTSIILASASSFPATASALSAINDTPIPDPALSTSLISQTDRMRKIEAVQKAQLLEVAELRGRSEGVVRMWYEGGVVKGMVGLAEAERRMEKVEAGVRRMERAKLEEEIL